MGRKPSPKPWDNGAFLTQAYIEEELSTQGVVKKIKATYGIDTFPNTVRRALKRHGIQLRTKSQAQSKFLDKNTHPMEGRVRSDEEREKISRGIQKNWETLSDEEVEKRKNEMSERAKLKWEWMDEEERTKNVAKMHKANREKSGQGSKNENLVAQMLEEVGFRIAQRTRDYSPRQQFEIDIAIPSISFAIEWDGAAHFAPIYGEEDLKRTVEKDRRKDRALLSNNWTVIRCRDHSTAHSLAFCRRAVEKILEVIRDGEKGKVHYVDAE